MNHLRFWRSCFTRISCLWIAPLLGMLLTIGCTGRGPLGAPTTQPDLTSTLRPPVSMQLGAVRKPLPYRIVSFHRGRADKRLIRLASELGFNGVQIQIEGSTVEGIKAFAKYDQKEKLVDFCHALGMSVTLWVHEMSDVPAEWMPEWLGPVNVDNQAIWSLLDTRYEWMLRDAVPQVDGLVLTVVETDIRATDTQVMVKLSRMLAEKCARYGKSLIVRTFVWYPEEFKNVMAAVRELPRDMVIMSKCVPQDWNIRGIDALELGDVGGRPQIEEFDVAGEYFLKSSVPNCMVDQLKRQFDYGVSKGISGICVRVDRDDDSVLHEPNEVNLWALAMLAGGMTDNVDDIWTAWATHRFGATAAGVVGALRPTAGVVEEMLSIGSFSYGDTRKFPNLGDEDFLDNMKQNWRWDARYKPEYEKAQVGDPAFVADVARAKDAAQKQAAACLLSLDLIKDQLKPEDYAILRTRLQTLKLQMDLRGPMVLAVLHYRQWRTANSDAARQAADRALQHDLDELYDTALPVYPAPVELKYLGRSWWVGAPGSPGRDDVYGWIYRMNLLRKSEDPRPVIPGHGLWDPRRPPSR